LELDANCRKGFCHLLDVTEAHTHSRPAEFDDVANLSETDTIGHIICLHFFRAAPVNTRALVRDDRITEGATNNAGPRKLVRSYRRSRTDVGFRIESQAKGFQESANSSYQSGIEFLHAHAAVTGVALDALVRIDDCSIPRRID